MNKKQTKIPEQETESAKREIQRIADQFFVEKVIRALEEQRKERLKKATSIHRNMWQNKQASVFPLIEGM